MKRNHSLTQITIFFFFNISIPPIPQISGAACSHFYERILKETVVGGAAYMRKEGILAFFFCLSFPHGYIIIYHPFYYLIPLFQIIYYPNIT